MKNWVTFLCFWVITGVPLARQTYAQSAPACLEALVGTWTFSTHGYSPLMQPFSSSGRFVASIGTDGAGNPTGRLAITETISTGGQISRLNNYAGTYQVFPDCSGGPSYSIPVQNLGYDFSSRVRRRHSFRR